MNKELSDVIKDARYSLIARLAVGSLWAPLLWLAVMALGEGVNLFDPPADGTFEGNCCPR